MGHYLPLFLYFRRCHTVDSRQMFNIKNKFCQLLDRNCGPLVLKVTILPIVPQPMPFKCYFSWIRSRFHAEISTFILCPKSYVFLHYQSELFQLSILTLLCMRSTTRGFNPSDNALEFLQEGCEITERHTFKANFLCQAWLDPRDLTN